MAVRLDHGEDALTEVHEINVTPFIDVMLVLLIIFMVAAPLATVDIVVNLPSSTAQPQPRPDKPLFLTIKPDLSLALGDQPVVPETPMKQREEKVEEKVEEPPTDVAMLPEPKEVPKPVEDEPPPPPPPTVAPREGRLDATTGSNPLPAWQKEINKILEKNK